VDGGFSYLRFGWNGDEIPTTVQIDLPQTKEELMRDYTDGINQLGSFPKETHSFLNIK
jgi:hypothetical protein